MTETSLPERITINDTPGLKVKLQDLLEVMTDKELVVDMTATAFVDSSVVALLIGLHRSCGNRDVEMSIKIKDANLIKTFQMLKLDKIFTLTVV